MIRALIFIIALAGSAWADEERLAIGLMTELSGPYATNGADCREGHELAGALYNTARKVDVFFGDTQGDAKTAVNEFNKLVDVHHISGLATNRSQVAIAINPLSAALALPYFAIAAHPDVRKTNPYAFRTWPSPAQESTLLAREVLARNHRTLSMVVLEDEYTSSCSDEFKARYAAGGGTVLSYDSMVGTAADFIPVIAKIKRTAPDAVYVYLGIPQLGPFLRKLREQGVTQPIYTNFWMQNAEVLKSAGNAAEGVLFTSVPIRMPELQQLVEARYGRQPSTLHLSCFVSSSALFQAAERSEGTTRKQLFESLSRLKEIRMPDSPLPIADREVVLPLEMMMIHNGKSEILD